ncbi:MAG: DUF4332 domain-containing protein [Bacillota bacterium]
MANYRIDDVEGIGKTLGQRLKDAGVKDTDSLLDATSSPRGRKELAKKCGISPERLLQFANMVDLYRIRGVGSEYAELLEAAGVDTVPDLARRNPANLAQKLAEVNEEKKLTRRVPPEKEVARWIQEAKTLPKIITH